MNVRYCDATRHSITKMKNFQLFARNFVQSAFCDLLSSNPSKDMCHLFLSYVNFCFHCYIPIMLFGYQRDNIQQSKLITMYMYSILIQFFI